MGPHASRRIAARFAGWKHNFLFAAAMVISQQESERAKSVSTWSGWSGNFMRIGPGALQFEPTRTRAAGGERVAAPVGNYWH